MQQDALRQSRADVCEFFGGSKILDDFLQFALHLRVSLKVKGLE